MPTGPAEEKHSENDRWTTVNCREDLIELIDPPEGEEREGGIQVAETYLHEMEHIGLLAFGIFNPFGPTLETLSIGIADDSLEPLSVLVRRSFHPLEDPVTQLLKVFRFGADGAFSELELNLFCWLCWNGGSPKSVDWFKPLCTTVPSGMVISEPAHRFVRSFRSGFSWLLSEADENLRVEVEKHESVGPNYWDQATWELKQFTSALSSGALSAASGDNDMPEPPLALRIPAICTDLGTMANREPSELFSRWWSFVSDTQWQEAFAKQIPFAWDGALRNIGLSRVLDEFHGWWSLFDPDRTEAGKSD